MKKILILTVFALSSYILLESCGSTKLIPVCSETPNYASYKDVKPIIDANCVKCHGNFDTYEGLKKPIENGSFDKLVLVRQSMPKGHALSQDEINLIMCWKNNGFKE